jgi:hypothetical protein
MDAAVVPFEESSDKMETEDLEETSGAMGVVMEWQELGNEQINVENIGPLEDRHDDLQRVKKWTQGKGGVRQKLVVAGK